MISLDEMKKFPHEAKRSFEDGAVIFAEGEDSREMYVVLEGEVVVSKQSARGQVQLAVLHKGDFVGEMSLLESLPRSATARARGITKLLAIHPGGFLLKIRRDPTFAFEMLQVLSRRIRKTNENLMAELSKAEHSPEALKAILTGSEFHKNEVAKGAHAPSAATAAATTAEIESATHAEDKGSAKKRESVAS